jgi:hypothetical protein
MIFKKCLLQSILVLLIYNNFLSYIQGNRKQNLLIEIYKDEECKLIYEKMMGSEKNITYMGSPLTIEASDINDNYKTSLSILPKFKF